MTFQGQESNGIKTPREVSNVVSAVYPACGRPISPRPTGEKGRSQGGGGGEGAHPSLGVSGPPGMKQGPRDEGARWSKILAVQ